MMIHQNKEAAVVNLDTGINLRLDAQQRFTQRPSAPFVRRSQDFILWRLPMSPR